MKKNLFFVLAVAGMLAGCSSSESVDVLVSPVDNPVDYSKVPIQVGVGRIATLNVRGTGTVGDIEGGTQNVWRGQTVNVMMFEKGTLNLAIKDKELDQNPIYNGTPFTTPDGDVSAVAKDASKAINYYPQSGQFDFWGYRLDGAELDEQPVAEVDAEVAEYTLKYAGEKVGLNFEIDGSQDVMIAKAQPSATDLTDHAAAAARAYSAYAARNGVQPELIFKHLLTRLNFQVVGGDENAINPTTGIFVKGVAVKSKATGQLVVAYTGEEIADANRIEWTEGQELKGLNVRSRAPGVTNPNTNLLDTLIYTQPTSTTEPTQLGEAVLVAPADQYEVVITLFQSKPVVEGGENIRREFSVSANVTKEGGFLLGHSYNVVIKLYGLQEIEITTTLTGWENGGDLPIITPEDND